MASPSASIFLRHLPSSRLAFPRPGLPISSIRSTGARTALATSSIRASNTTIPRSIQRPYSQSSVPIPRPSSSPPAFPSPAPPSLDLSDESSPHQLDHQIQAILDSSSLLPQPLPPHLETLLTLIKTIPPPVPLPISFDTIETLLQYLISLIPSATSEQKLVFLRCSRTLEGVWKALLDGEEGLPDEVRHLVGQRVYIELLNVFGSCGGWEEIKALLAIIEQEGIQDEAIIPQLLVTAERYVAYLRAVPSFSPIPATTFLLRLSTLSLQNQSQTSSPSLPTTHHLSSYLQLLQDRFSLLHPEAVIESAGLVLQALARERDLRSTRVLSRLLALFSKMKTEERSVDRLWEVAKMEGKGKINSELFNQFLASKRSDPARARQEWDSLVSDGYIPTYRNLRQLVYAHATSDEWLEAARCCFLVTLLPLPPTETDPSISNGVSFSSTPSSQIPNPSSSTSISSASPSALPSSIIIYLLNLVTTANGSRLEARRFQGSPSQETILEMRQVLCDLFGEGVWDSVRDRVEKEVEEEKRRLEEKAAARIVSRDP